MWFYKDLQGVRRGPFSQKQMSAWYEMGYFNDDLEIAYGENSIYLHLKNYKEISKGNAGGVAQKPQKSVNSEPFYQQ